MATGTTIRRGSIGPDVIRWQLIIGVTADGNFGPITEQKTKEWQAAHGLTADGVVGPLTWGAATDPVQSAVQNVAQAVATGQPPDFLNWTQGTPAPAPTPPVPPNIPTSATGVAQVIADVAGYPTLRRGSTGEYVTMWQQVIGSTPDGVFGNNTESMTKTWQKSRGLTADGVVGPLTWGAAAAGGFLRGKPGLSSSFSIAGLIPEMPSIPTWAKYTGLGLLAYALYEAYRAKQPKKAKV